MNEPKTGLDAMAPSRLARFCAGVATAAMRPSTVDAPGPADSQRANQDAPQIPPRILCAIDAATDSLRVFQIACGLFAVDYGEVGGPDDVAQGRLERAVARALLDAWTDGHGSAEAVGSAYALVAERVAGYPANAVEQRLVDSVGGGRTASEASARTTTVQRRDARYPEAKSHEHGNHMDPLARQAIKSFAGAR